MKKRLVSLLLAFSMMLTFLPVGAVTAFAEETASGEASTPVTGTWGDNLNWTFDTTTGALTITGSGAMKDYKYTGDNSKEGWRPYKKSIQSVTFDGEITSIGIYAFYDCTNLKSVKYAGYNGSDNFALPDSVTQIGKQAFQGCSGLTGNLVIPNTVTEIGDKAFINCSGLNGTLTLSNQLTAIGNGTFKSCTGLTGALIIPDGVTSIGESAFEWCRGFNQTLSLPTNLTTIGDKAFKDCSGLTGTLVIPDTVSTIGTSAFQNCKGFNGNLKLSNSLTEIPVDAFYNCSGLTGTLVIPSSVTKIYYRAFKNCSSFTGDLVIPDSVTEFVNGGFADNTHPFGQGGAFEGCSGFNGTLTLSENLTVIPHYTFRGCSNLQGPLTFPEKLTTIGENAFQGWKQLTGTLTIPAHVTSIGGNAFSDCSSLEILDYSNATESSRIFSCAFQDCTNLKKVYLPEKISSIDGTAFYRDTSVKVYYPGYSTEWFDQTDPVGGLTTDKLALNLGENASHYYILRPICYYVDVTFNANGGTFDGSATTKTVNGEANKLYRTENMTAEMVNAIGEPTKAGYHFVGWSLTQDGAVVDPTDIKKSATNYSYDGVDDGLTLYAVYSLAASVTINDFAAADAEGYPTTIKAGENHKFTLTGDAGTDAGAQVALTLDDNTNATLQYRNSDADAWQSVGNTTFDITTVKDVQFRVTAPDDASTAEITLTATVQDATGKAIADAKNDSVTFAVKAHENATVTVTAPTDTNVVAGEPSKPFTVTVDEKDDTGAQAKFTLSDNVDKLQYSTDGENWTTMTEADLSKAWSKDDLNGKQFRVVPKDTGTSGNATVTVTLVKADGTTEIDGAEDNVTYAVTARHHAELKLDKLDGKELVATVPHTFTVTVTPYDDDGDATLIFGDVTGLKDSDGNPVPETGYTVTGLTKNGEAKTLTFTLTPDAESTGKTLKVTLKTADCAPETTANYTVRVYGKTAVAIDGLDNGTIKAGDDKTFTVKVEPGDDAADDATVTITVSGDNKDAVDKIQYRDKDLDDEWKDVPADGLPIDKVNDLEFRVVTDPDAKDGDVTLTVTVKNGDTDLTYKDAGFTVAKKIYSYPLTITNGKLVSVTDGETVLDIQLENGTASIPAGAQVKVAFDGAAFADSGSKFGHWDITGLTQDDANKYTSQESFTFTMPAGKVTLEGMTQDSTIDDGPSIIGGIAIGATIVAGGAALTYQTYALATDFFGYLWELPYFPSNRSALALMLWQDAGKPMPVSELLYPDVGQEEQDMDLQHAARWAMENELLPDKNDKDADLAPEEMKFFPNDAITKYSVLKAWKKAQGLKKNA